MDDYDNHLGIVAVDGLARSHGEPVPGILYLLLPWPCTQIEVDADGGVGTSERVGSGNEDGVVVVVYEHGAEASDAAWDNRKVGEVIEGVEESF
jgi:hypothetical protein